MNRRFILSAFVLILALIALSQSLYIVDQREKAILMQFGRVVKPNLSPGFHFKIPFIQSVLRFDGRIQNHNLPEEIYLSSEQKGLVVDSYILWRIASPLKFFTATGGDIARAQSLLASRMDTGLRNRFGKRTITELVSGDRDALLADLSREMDEYSMAELGIQTIDTRVMRVDFSAEISESVFSRMRSDREQEAQNIRAGGRQKAQELMADANKQVEIIKATAQAQAERISGKGEADAAQTLTKAFAKNPRYYSLYQRIKTLDKGLSKPTDILIVNPNDDFLLGH